MQLDVKSETGWQTLACGVTDADGRCGQLLAREIPAKSGQYRVRFESGAYFTARGIATLYPYVEIVFEVSDVRHYHIPLLLAANGFTTYRGS